MVMEKSDVREKLDGGGKIDGGGSRRGTLFVLVEARIQLNRGDRDELLMLIWCS